MQVDDGGAGGGKVKGQVGDGARESGLRFLHDKPLTDVSGKRRQLPSLARNAGEDGEPLAKAIEQNVAGSYTQTGTGSAFLLTWIATCRLGLIEGLGWECS